MIQYPISDHESRPKFPHVEFWWDEQFWYNCISDVQIETIRLWAKEKSVASRVKFKITDENSNMGIWTILLDNSGKFVLTDGKFVLNRNGELVGKTHKIEHILKKFRSYESPEVIVENWKRNNINNFKV